MPIRRICGCKVQNCCLLAETHHFKPLRSHRRHEGTKAKGREARPAGASQDQWTKGRCKGYSVQCTMVRFKKKSRPANIHSRFLIQERYILKFRKAKKLKKSNYFKIYVF